MDKLTPERRSANMARIRSHSTKPEMAVRQLAHRLGYRYQLHRKDLPGKPDLVFPGRRAIIFVHGCFWHQHPETACTDSALPKSRPEYWLPKLQRNQQRDSQNMDALVQDGWRVLIIWECETHDEEELAQTLHSFLA
ncbi:very short patch repair endonuclease [Phyllobacterium sp. P5_D12]